MRKKSIITFCLVVVVAILLNVVAICGLPGEMKSNYGGMFNKDTGIRQGIDLAGGSVITFQAEKDNPTADEMEAVKAVYQTRLTSAGYSEARISGEGNQLTIEIPTNNDVTGTDEAEQTAAPTEAATEAASEAAAEEAAATATETATEEAAATEAPEAAAAQAGMTSETDDVAQLLSEVAKLTFRNANGDVVLEGTDVKSAQSIYGQPSEGANQQYYVQVEFTSEGAKKFAEATRAAIGSTISIFMDEVEVSRPTVQSAIEGGSCVITGSFEAEDSSRLASQINSGNLPFAMNKISQSTVGAELGKDALPTSQKAAVIGIILVMVFMIWRYRLPGLVADLSLLIYIGLICLAMGVFRVNLSLSGIAGIVLSIGMAVDADCIIFERMKEELALGKSIRASVESGFSKAFSAILDSNITTIISCVVLYLSGIGTVTGFAMTLGIGVVLSMFTAIVITKFLLRNLVNFGIKNRNLFYSAKKTTGGAENE